MMGCKVGKWCFIDTTLFSEFDLVEIGDRACLNLGATIQTHLFEDRIFKADRLSIGEGCTVGNMAVVLYGTEMQSGSVLRPLSVLMKGETLPPQARIGTASPASPSRSAQTPRLPISGSSVRVSSSTSLWPCLDGRDPRRRRSLARRRHASGTLSGTCSMMTRDPRRRCGLLAAQLARFMHGPLAQLP